MILFLNGFVISLTVQMQPLDTGYKKLLPLNVAII